MTRTKAALGGVPMPLASGRSASKPCEVSASPQSRTSLRAIIQCNKADGRDLYAQFTADELK